MDESSSPDVALTLPRAFSSKNTEDSAENELTNTGEVVKPRRSLEELLAAAEEEFDLMDSIVDTTIKTLKNGREIQKLATIRNFADLLNSEETCNEAINRVLPVIQDLLALEPSNLDIHCESAVVFKTIIKDKVYTQKFNGLSDKLLDYILQNIENQKENVTAAAWLESLVEIADLIPVQTIIELIVPLAISQAEPNKRVQRRVISARLVEKLCTIIPADCVRHYLASCVKTLCHDPSAAVRTTIAQRLSVFAQSLNSPTECVVWVLPCLNKLCKDDDSGVREAVLNAIAVCLPFLTKESLKTAIFPLLKKCAEQSVILQDVSLTVVACQLGHWLEGLNDVLSSQEIRWFLDIYCRICEISWRDNASSLLLYISCRRMCAYNFPCFAMIFGIEHFDEHLMSLLERFCKDNDEEVRSTIASGFHEIVKMRSSEQQYSLINPFVELLCSGTAEIVQHLMANLNLTLPKLYTGFDSQMNSQRQKVADTSSKNAITRRGSIGGRPTNLLKDTLDNTCITRTQLDCILIGCNRLIRGRGCWRSHEAYLTNIAVVRQLIPRSSLFASFVPMLQQEVLTARALPCRIAAAKSLLLIMHDCPIKSQRSTIMEFFIKDIGQHQSCHRRRLLIDILPFILENFSREFFLRELFPSILKLAEDKVSNIRLQLCRIFPIIKRYFVFPTNDTELSKVEKVVRDLLTTETNLYNRQLIQQFAVELSRAETDTKECSINETKLIQEKSLWSEKELDNKLEDEEICTDMILPDIELKSSALQRSATTNVIDLTQLASTSNSSCANNINSIGNSISLSNISNLNNQSLSTQFRSSSPLTPNSTLPPSNWRTNRPDRPKLVIVRPQPQVTVTQRSPSPMPFGNINEKSVSNNAATDERKSKLPLATTRYRSTTNSGSSELGTQILPSFSSHSSNVSSPTIKNSDSSLNKYRARNSESLSSRTRNTGGQLLSKSTTSSSSPTATLPSTRRLVGKRDDNIMSRSTSSIMNEKPNYSIAHSSSSSSLKNIRRPYSLMKVQSTSDIKRKPSHMSIRIISMSSVS